MKKQVVSKLKRRAKSLVNGGFSTSASSGTSELSWIEAELRKPRANHYKLAYRIIEEDQREEALERLAPLAELGDYGASLVLGALSELGEDFEGAFEYYGKSIEQKATGVAHYRRSLVGMKLGQTAEARQDAYLATRLVPRSKNFWRQYAKASAGQLRWAQLELYREGAQYLSDDINWRAKLAQLTFEMHHFDEAAALFDELFEETAESRFGEKASVSYLLAGSDETARKVYQGVQIQSDDVSERLNFPEFLRRAGYPDLSISESLEQISLRPDLTNDLLPTLARAYKQAYRYAEALECINKVLRGSFSDTELVRLRARCLEATGNYRAAQEDYLSVYVLAGGDETALYRAVYCSWKIQDFEDIEGLLGAHLTSALPEAGTVETTGRVIDDIEKRIGYTENYCVYKNLGIFHFRLGDFERAVEYLERANEGNLLIDQDSHLYLSLAYLRLANVECAARSFLASRPIWSNRDSDDERIFRTARWKYLAYRNFIDELPVEENTVLYDSQGGHAFTGNVLRLLERNLVTSRGRKQRHVVATNSPEILPTEIVTNPLVRVVARESISYIKYLATAGWLVNDTTFPLYFSRRPEQRYLNTWHGTPLKSLGKDVKGDGFHHRNGIRCHFHTTHFALPNVHTARVLIDRYDVAGVFPGTVAITGQPRIDATVGISDERVAQIRASLEVDERPIVLYAPTWRGTLSDKQFDTQKLVSDLESLAMLDANVIFKPHNLTAKLLEGISVPVQTIGNEIDVNELLGAVDYLVTDYSSIFFDFYPTNRPVYFYVYDEEEYYGDRGGPYFDVETLPGKVSRDIETLVENIKSDLELDSALLSRSESSVEEFCPMDDGEATDRVLKYFFEDDRTWNLDVDFGRGNKREILLYQGNFNPNGISSSFQNLCETYADHPDLNLSVVYDPVQVYADEKRVAQLEKLPESVRHVGKFGYSLQLPYEIEAINTYAARLQFLSEQHRKIVSDAYKVEFHRLFGYAKYDSIVHFEGYSVAFTGLLSGHDSDAKSAIVLHSDMQAELNARFPSLRAVFEAYNNFDCLISVSESVGDVNREFLVSNYKIDEDKFSFIDNLIVPDEPFRRLEVASRPEELGIQLDTFQIVFTTAARMSKEKGHDILLKAMKIVKDKYPSTALIIAGDGPERKNNEHLIQSLGLDDNVFLPGFLSNPFGVIDAGDCFVFPSRYEGQGISAIEALILGKPVIGFNVTGTKSALANGRGRLVDDVSPEAFAEAMMEFIENPDAFSSSFDTDEYVQNTIDRYSKLFLTGSPD